MNDAQQRAVALYPELQRLIELKHNRWVFQPAVVDGVLELLTGHRVWLVGGWTDAIAIRNRTDAKAYRCGSDGGVVFTHEDTLARVLDKLIDLPHPDAPHAPRLVLSSRRLWVPGMPM